MGWAVLSPLSKLTGWAPGPVGDMSNGARGWILWTALGIMCADSLVSLLPVALEYVNATVNLARTGYSPLERTGTSDTEPEERLVPDRWVTVGLTSSIAIGTLLVWMVFGNEAIKPWATLLGFALGGLLSIIG